MTGGVLRRRGDPDADAHMGGGGRHARVGAGVGAMHPQAEGRWRMPGAGRRAAGTASLGASSRGRPSSEASILDVQPPEL